MGNSGNRDPSKQTANKDFSPISPFPSMSNQSPSQPQSHLLLPSQSGLNSMSFSSYMSMSNSNVGFNNNNNNSFRRSSLPYQSQSSTNPMIRITDASDYRLSSMDDLVSETGLDDNSKYRLKYYNKALISYLSQQGLNINPLKLNAKHLHLKEKHSSFSILHHTSSPTNIPISNNNNNNNNTSTSTNNNSNKNIPAPIKSTASTNSNIETFITGNGQILFLPFNPQKKKRRRHNNIRDEYNDEDDDHDHDHEPDNDHGHNHPTEHSPHNNVNNDNDDNDNDDEEDDDDNDDDNDIEPDEADEPYPTSDLRSSPVSPRSEAMVMNSLGKKLKNQKNKGLNQQHPPNPNHDNDTVHNITNHTFSVIIKLNKKSNLNKIVKVNYHTHMAIKLIPGEYSRKEPIDDRFRTSEMIDWDLDLSNPDCYIPFKSSSPLTNNEDLAPPNIDAINDDSLDSISLDSIGNTTNPPDANSPSKQSVDVKYSDQPTQEIRSYQALNPKCYVDEPTILQNDSFVEFNLFKNTRRSSLSEEGETFSPGYYIFLLPVVYPLNTPESIEVPHAFLSHQFSIQIQKATVSIPTLQAPQSAFLSHSSSHYHKFDEPNLEFAVPQSQAMAPSFSSVQNTHTSKTSFFKKIGLTKGSPSSSNKMESSKHSISPRGSISSATKMEPSFSFSTRSRATSLTNPLLSHFHSGNNNHPTVYNYSYKLPAIRLPPSDATSTLNKSIYVNKVWNNALNYELLLPRKYTQLSPPSSMSVTSNDKFLRPNTFLLQMKLVPLVKNLILKRIKINIIEKITYTPKIPGPGENKKQGRSKSTDRTVSLMEIKTKEKANSNLNPNRPTTPLKAQIIKGCVNDNLLTFCYNNDKSSCFEPADSNSTINNNNVRNPSRSRSNSRNAFLGSKKMSRFLDNVNSSQSTINNTNKSNDVVITNPVKLQCPLDFVANDDSNFISTVYDNLCTGTSDLTGLHDGSDYMDRGNDTMSVFSVNSNTNDKGDVLSDDDQTYSPSPVRRQRFLSFSGSNNSTINTNKNQNNNNNNNNNNSNNGSNGNEGQSTLFNSHTFLPDTSFSNLKVRHRLQISFRISRPDPKLKNPDGEPKLHHYEVIVDTPIVFVSPFCVTEALDLPSYEDAVRIGMFEVLKNSSKFAMSQAYLNDNDSSYGVNSEENNAIFVPCSPLMSDSSPMAYMLHNDPNNSYSYTNYYNYNNNNNNNNTSTAQFTNLLPSTSVMSTMSPTLPAYDTHDSLAAFNRRRSDSGGKSFSSTPPVNPSSLLSAALSRSMENSNSLNSVLANDLSNLSLNNGVMMNNINTIDNVMGSGPVNEPPPPEYTEIGFKTPTHVNKNSETLTIPSSKTGSEISTPSIVSVKNNSFRGSNADSTSDIDPLVSTTNSSTTTKSKLSMVVGTSTNNDMNIIPKDMVRNSSSNPVIQKMKTNSSDLAGSRTSLKSEKMALLHGDSQGMALKDVSGRNSTVDSIISTSNDNSNDNSFDLGDRGDIDSIINMSSGNLPTLNLTPTQNKF